jgi:drug/metabolite transporter (DMT)-like permease
MRSRFAPVALLGSSTLLWGTAYRATAIGTSHSSALMFGALRSAPAGLALAVVILVVRPQRPSRRGVVLGGASGFLMVTFWIFALSEGVVRAGAANAAVLVNSSTLFVAVLGRIFLDERLTGRQIVGLLVGFAGIVVMFSSELRLSGDARLLSGMAIALLGGIGWGAGTVLVKWLSREEPSLDALALAGLQYAVGVPVLLAVAFATKGTAGTDWASGSLWGGVAYVGLGAVAGTVCYFLVLRLLEATQVAAALLLVPVVAVVVEIARGNTPPGVTFVGMAIAIAGVAAVAIPARSRHDLATDPVLRRS